MYWGNFCLPDRSWLLPVFFIFALISAFYHYSTAYLRGLSDTKLEKDRDNGNRRANRLLILTEKFEIAEAALRIGCVLNESAALVLLALAYYDLPRELADACGLDFGAYSLWISVSSYFIVILLGGIFLYFFAELLPSRIADVHVDMTTAYKGGAVLLFFSAIFRPLAHLLVSVVRLLLKAFGIDAMKTEGRVTEDEILDMVDMGEESGNIESSEKEMIENIFDFSDIMVSSVMTHRTSVAAIDIESTDDEICEIIRSTGFSRFPVYADDMDHIVGILNAKTFLLDRASSGGKSLKALLYPPYLVPESVHADKLLTDMKKSKNHLAVVLDEYGGTLGIVTMEDLLEEIVGNIYDETDDPQKEQELQKIGDNLWRVAGSINLETLYEELELPYKEEDHDTDTLGGLLFSRLTLIPQDKTVLEMDIGRLHIVSDPIKGRRVEWANVSILDEESHRAEEDQA